MPEPSRSPDHPRIPGDYGIDRPAVAAAFALLIALAGAFVVTGALSDEPLAAVGPLIAVLFFVVGLGITVRSGRVGKPRLWAGLLDDLDLTGDERILDIGCGRGFVLIAAASRLSSGSAVGIDIWRTKDQSGNSLASCERNIETAGVSDRAEVHTADATALPFDTASFDVVLASLSIGAIALPRERERAIAEIVRVLRPGGRVAVLDVRATDKIADLMARAGLVEVTRSGAQLSMYPPAYRITASRP